MVVVEALLSAKDVGCQLLFIFFSSFLFSFYLFIFLFCFFVLLLLDFMSFVFKCSLTGGRNTIKNSLQHSSSSDSVSLPVTLFLQGEKHWFYADEYI